MTGINIEQVHTPSAPETVLRDMARFLDVMEAEDMPGDPPTPWQARAADWRHDQVSYPAFRWLLRKDGDLAAYALAAYDLAQNLENAHCRIQVHPDLRANGYARALAGPLFDHLEGAGRKRIDTWIKKDARAEGFAEKLGLNSVYGEKRSRLVIAELDMDLMRSWIERASERAGEYELQYFRTPVPEEVIEKFCDLLGIMNTAPKEDYEQDDEQVTPSDWRDLEDGWSISESVVHIYVAVHRPSGDYVGLTDLKTQGLHPDLAWQMDTGVHPDHRNKGLGRWLKAAMIERLVGEHPEVDRIDTFNAGSNEPMLNINVAMGFKPVHLSNVWQGDLATARDRLGV